MSAVVVLAALPVICAYALFQRRRWVAVLGMGMASFLLAVVYVLQGAPDVAVAEAAIGAALVTFIYVLAIRRTGRLVVIAAEVPGLLHRRGREVDGVEFEILQGFATKLGLDLTVRFATFDDAMEALRGGSADILAGGFVPQTGEPALVTRGFLDTRFYVVGAGEPCEAPRFRDELRALLRRVEAGDVPVTIDLARLLALMRRGVEAANVAATDAVGHYAFGVCRRRPDLHARLERHLEEIEATGALERIVERYLA